jgi:hypothetical protein
VIGDGGLSLAASPTGVLLSEVTGLGSGYLIPVERSARAHVPPKWLPPAAATVAGIATCAAKKMSEVCAGRV